VEPSGRLELTWTNKHLRLITTETGGYEWVDPSDPRVSEVRLLQSVESVGDVDGPDERNLLIEGDALHALTALNRIPELADRYAGQIRLVYIDPPFNTGQAFANYDDNLEHSVWLSMLRDRLVQIKPLLAANGSIWVHLDDAEVHRCRCVMDEVLGASNFVTTVVWKRRNDPRNTARHISLDHDTLLVYSLDLASLTFNQLPRTEQMDAAYTNPDGDARGPWRRGDLAARNFYSRGLYAITTPSGRHIDGPPSGSYWRVSEEELHRLDGDGRIYWGPAGESRPYLKRFLSEVAGGRVPSSVWPPEEVGFVRNGKEEVRALVGDVFATPKPRSTDEPGGGG
jgi:adenine-specific DNA-methyltransferase